MRIVDNLQRGTSYQVYHSQMGTTDFILHHYTIYKLDVHIIQLYINKDCSLRVTHHSGDANIASVETKDHELLV